jgi:hypothetical protein
MDLYSKFIFTVIALLLAVIAVNSVWRPVDAITWGDTKPPTWGDYLDVRRMEGSSEARKKAFDNLKRSIPLVYVDGGSISVD